MDILVIGGSYFFGRWFVQYAHKDNSVTVINRGNVPICLENVTELKADRHDSEKLKNLTDKKYDCIVDFCAYEEGDIASIAELFCNKGGRYIYISTVDVYKKGTGMVISEDSPMGEPEGNGPESNYIRGKILLEKELKVEEKKLGIKGVSVRPAILYGPGNYAPRESLYFEWIKKAGQIIVPSDADGSFQFAYVADAARALVRLCELPVGELEESYIFANHTMDNYESFEQALREATDIEYESLQLGVKEVLDNGIPLPFPLTKRESEEYSSASFCKLIPKITELKDGLLSSWKVFG